MAENVSWGKVTGFWKDLRELGKLAVPVSLSSIFSFLLPIQTMLFIGRLGPEELGAVALGNTWCNVTGASVALGILGALDTLCSQAYGAKEYKKVGLLLQRGWVVATIISIPICLMWWFSGPFFLLLGQNPEIARKTSIYTRSMIPSLFPMLYTESFKKYLSAQSIVNPPMIGNIIVLVIAVLTSYICIDVLGYGFAAAAVGVTVANWVLFVGLFWSGEHKLTWPAWSMEIFQGLWPFFKLGGPGMLMLCAEWWAYELLIFFSGWLGTISLDTMTIMLSTMGLTFMTPLGISVAVGTRVGNELGANSPEAAKRAAIISLIVIIPIQVLSAGVILICAPYWGTIWSNSSEVISMVAHILPLTCAHIIPDGFQGVASGVVRGCGRQMIGAAINLCIYYLLGVPLAYLLGIHFKYGVIGIASGIFFASCIQATTYLGMIMRTDWAEESRQARERIDEGDGKLEEYKDMLLEEIGGVSAKKLEAKKDQRRGENTSSHSSSGSSENYDSVELSSDDYNVIN